MSAAIAITGIIARTFIDLAFIGAGLKLALTVAPRFQIAAPKAPQVRVNLQPETAASDQRSTGTEAAKTGPGSEEEAAGIAALIASGKRTWDIIHPQGADGSVPPGGTP